MCFEVRLQFPARLFLKIPLLLLPFFFLRDIPSIAQ